MYLKTLGIKKLSNVFLLVKKITKFNKFSENYFSSENLCGIILRQP